MVIVEVLAMVVLVGRNAVRKGRQAFFLIGESVLFACFFTVVSSTRLFSVLIVCVFVFSARFFRSLSLVLHSSGHFRKWWATLLRIAPIWILQNHQDLIRVPVELVCFNQRLVNQDQSIDGSTDLISFHSISSPTFCRNSFHLMLAFHWWISFSIKWFDYIVFNHPNVCGWPSRQG